MPEAVICSTVQASERWQNVGMGEVEVTMLKQLRRELELDSPAQTEQRNAG